MAKEKVILAYSGGLDTSVIIPWLIENYDYEVIAVAGDVGQGKELDPLHEKAIKSGASKLYIADIKEEFVNDFIFPTLKAGAVYENKYLLGTATARPAIAKALVDVAKKEGAVAICHGATGKGNDQVRFELTIKALAPEMKIIAPWRIWDIKSRSEAIEYAKARNIDIPVKKGHSYSMDRNLWHLSHEGEDLENPWNEPKSGLLDICKNIEDAPDQAEYVSVGFEKGIPVSVDGKKMGGVELIQALNEIGAKHGVGMDDMVENRLVGIKSRGVYENPGGCILYKAHESLESITLDKETAHYKQLVAVKFADIVYNGQWYSPLREALSAFVDKTCEYVTGTVKMKLYKGNCVTVGIKSDYTLYSEEFATFEDDDVYDHKDAGGFITLFGLPQMVNAMRDERINKK
jgi:argininosuccinate synthase